MTMSASVLLTSLPRDAHQALADAEAIDTGKGASAQLRALSVSIITVLQSPCASSRFPRRLS